MDGCAFVAAITLSFFGRGMFIGVSEARGDMSPLLNFDQAFGRAGRLHLKDPGEDR